MIKFEVFDNTKQNLSCNACCKFEEPKLYEITFPVGSNRSLIVRLCKDCAKELREVIKFKNSNRNII